MKRDYYQDIGYKLFLFYLVFGVSAEELEVSQKRHKVDELPEGLDIRSFTREAQGEWIDRWFSGAYGSVMREADAVLFERCKAVENCVVLQGTVKNDSTLDYMRNVIGIIQAFVDKGAVGIMDPQTITLYAPEQWTERFFGQEVNAQKHVIVLCSREGESYWLTIGACHREQRTKKRCRREQSNIDILAGTRCSRRFFCCQMHVSWGK